MSRATHYPYHIKGLKKGQPKLCKLCPRPTPIYLNSEHLPVCYAHYLERNRERQRRFKANHPKRTAAARRALFNSDPMKGLTLLKPDGTRKNVQQVYRVTRRSLIHWRDLAMNHPEKLPPGVF